MNQSSFERQFPRWISAAGVVGFFLVLFLIRPEPAKAIPAFARKYGLPCSACHIAWPLLNNFGQVFRDNGYQMMNDRDSPITHDPSYFPASARITPQWHRESIDHVAVDAVAGNAATEGPGTVTESGFDLSGMDMWFGGTLFKNISFILLPSSNPSAGWHFESAFVRFDNILGSRWFNFKFGRFELDTPVSEKRLTTLSTDGGLYYIYHFLPPNSNAGLLGNAQGIGNNQLGVEVLGHSADSYTRYSVAVVSSSSGQVNLVEGKTVDVYANASQAWNIGSIGMLRAGGYAYFGEWPTFFQTVGGVPSPPPGPGPFSGTGIDNKPYYLAGGYSTLFTDRWTVSGVYLHGSMNAYLANNTSPAFGQTPLAAGARSAAWNGGFLEAIYMQTPQLEFIGRYETVRMQQQGNPLNPGDQGNLDALTFGFRWYPFMFSRAGLAYHTEYSIVRSRGIGDTGGVFVPTVGNSDSYSSSVFLGFDFHF
ncbi:MAG TPA: hypothetical protein VEG64_10320 [Candidatus Sulfotelmatobacter sp.]|nr:hypothetical protein [Candidatus Sulfotelmatobacter sp.]